jgi:hypothetical protein
VYDPYDDEIQPMATEQRVGQIRISEQMSGLDPGQFGGAVVGLLRTATTCSGYTATRSISLSHYSVLTNLYPIHIYSGSKAEMDFGEVSFPPKSTSLILKPAVTVLERRQFSADRER